MGYAGTVTFRLAPLVIVSLLAVPGIAGAAGDYDPESDEWNGLSRLVELARARGIDLDHPDEVDYGALGSETSLLIVYPTVPLDREALVAYLRRGGRVLIADDFGTAGPLLAQLGVERDERPIERGLFFRDRPTLPVAAPATDEHVLTVGVRRLVTNHPTTLITDLPPVFTAGQPARTLVSVGAVGDGRVVLLGDPSVLINNMLEMRGNERFARNLLGYLSGGGEGRRLVLLTGRFSQRGGGGGAMAEDASRARRETNARLARFSGSLAPPPPEQPPPLGLVIACALAALALVALVVFRLEPRPRLYSGRWLRPLTAQPSAGFVGTVEYLQDRSATHLYPLMILKRELEERLLDGLGLSAPARLNTVLAHYAKHEPSRRKQKALEGLLIRLSAIAGSAATTDAPSKISARELKRTVERARALLKPLGQDILEP